MSLSRSLAIFRHENRLLRTQAVSMLQLLLLPLLFMVFLQSVSKFGLEQQGYRNVNGSEQVVPGMALMFAFFLCGSVSFSFFIEHGWGTWERLRASEARPAEIILGKSLSPWCLLIGQQAVLLGFGVVVLGMDIRGSVLGLFLVAFAFGAPLVAWGVLLAAVCTRAQQLNLGSSLLAMVFAGLGGAFVPIEALPGWTRSVSGISPTYWAMQGYRAVILDGEGLAAVVRPVGVLLAMGAVLMAVGVARLRFEQPKLMMG